MINSNKIPTALLTIGEGPIAKAVFDDLSRKFNLKAVIFSRRANKKRLSVLRNYYFFYIFQTLLFKCWCLLFRLRVSHRKVATSGIQTFFWVDKSNEAAVIDLLNKLGIKLVITCGFQHILSKEFIGSFKNCINIHPSLLPQYRSSEPVMWGIILHDKNFGITAHQMDEGVDTGNIIAQEMVSVPSLPLRVIIEYQLARKVGLLMNKIIDFMSNDTILAIKQEAAVYYPAPTKKNIHMIKSNVYRRK